jgi:hypothetical protein
MYALINPKSSNLEKLNLPNTSGIPKFLQNLAMEDTTLIPYMQEQTLKITAIFTCQKNYYNTACNIYHEMYDMYDTLGAHMDNGFKVTPSTTPPTIRWNASMLLNNIFEQVIKMYGRPTSNAMRQKMMTFCPHTILKICLKSCSNVAPTVKKLPSSPM